MPHIIIEYSQNSFNKEQTQAMMQDVYQQIKLSSLFDIKNVKIRLHPITEFLLDTQYQGFIHITCRIHKGRILKEKQRLSADLVKTLANWSQPKVVTTCEVIEMERDVYAKKISD